jgi:hypothetical protein
MAPEAEELPEAEEPPEAEEEPSVRVWTGSPALWQDWVYSTQRIGQICNQ